MHSTAPSARTVTADGTITGVAAGEAVDFMLARSEDPTQVHVEVTDGHRIVAVTGILGCGATADGRAVAGQSDRSADAHVVPEPA